MAPVDSMTWEALGLTLTLLGLLGSFWVWRRRGAASGLRAAAWALLPLAAAWTGTLQLAWAIARAVVEWAARLVFSPIVWAGLLLVGVSMVLFVVSGLLRRRTSSAPAGSGGALPPSQTSSPALGPDRGRPSVGDDEMADIEAILKKHGIG
ncbi:hypothetical protein BH18ACT9_BH18ACT9_10760 [soil metagenome]